ncbi:unnamed protein product [Alopecurus aequalis]
MASPPAFGLTEYERLRAENILTTVRRKADELAAAIKSSESPAVRRKADELSAAIKSSESPAVRRKAGDLSAATKSSEPPAVRRRSILLSQPPPDAQPTPTQRRAPIPKPTPSQRRAPKPTPSRNRAPNPLPPPPKPLPQTPRSTTFSSSLASTILEAVSLSPGAAKPRADDFDAGKELVLAPANVRRLLPSRLVGLLVLPLVNRTVVAAGNKVGNIGFWHADPEPGVVAANGVFEYLPHRGPVAEIVAHPRVPHKIYSCSSSHGGEICLMDLEKENFNIIHSCRDPVHSLCQAPDSASCLYFGAGAGKLKLFDERMGKVSTTWDAHGYPINSIDFHPHRKHMLATSSKDGTSRIWDLRSLKSTQNGCLKVLAHDHSVHLAYFSPSGHRLATTSLDDTVRVFDGDDFDSSHIIKHNNQTGRWISTFKAIWGWNDADLFIGNMERAIDIISVGISNGGLSTASNSACLKSEHMTTIPCRFSAHPYKVGHLACASSSSVFLWTRA